MVLNMLVSRRAILPIYLTMLNIARTLDYSARTITIEGNRTTSLLGLCDDCHLICSPLLNDQADFLTKYFKLNYLTENSGLRSSQCKISSIW